MIIRPQNMKATKSNISKNVFLAAASLLWCLPIIWVFLCSFKKQLLGGIPASITNDWAAINFLQLGRYGFVTAVTNSLGVAVLSSVVGTTGGLFLSLGLICRPKPLL